MGVQKLPDPPAYRFVVEERLLYMYVQAQTRNSSLKPCRCCRLLCWSRFPFCSRISALDTTRAERAKIVLLGHGNVHSIMNKARQRDCLSFRITQESLRLGNPTWRTAGTVYEGGVVSYATKRPGAIVVCRDMVGPRDSFTVIRVLRTPIVDT